MLIDELERLIGAARREVLLVAPFVKFNILARLFDRIGADVEITVVTRWWPEEIAAGVSDIEIWQLFRGQSKRRILLRHDLHAKAYRGDDECLIGSANLTGRALGLSRAPNLELLVPMHRTNQTIASFESSLFDATVQVDDDLYNSTRLLVEALPSWLEVRTADEVGLPSCPSVLLAWVPLSRQPEDLQIAYRGARDMLTAAALSAALEDLVVLQLPPGLGDESFRAAVGARLLTMPIVAAVDRFISDRERRFGEVRAQLSARIEPVDATYAWQTLFRWMMFFLPGRYRYRRPNYSELISRSAVRPSAPS